MSAGIAVAAFEYLLMELHQASSYTVLLCHGWCGYGVVTSFY
jgi:hypothetical protein